MPRRALLPVLLAALPACSGGRPPRPPLVVLLSSPVASLLPNTTSQAASLSVLSNVYEPLVDLDAGLALRPGLAESWHTPDELTWVFRLRDGVRFHDGRPLRAEDVVRCLEHARSDPASRRRGEFAEVERIVARDPLTVELRTSRPLDTVALRLSSVLVWDGGAAGGTPPAGTGPYRIRETRPDGGVALQAFQDHRQGAASVAGAVFEVVPDAGERARRVREGTAQVAVDVAPPAERSDSRPRRVSRPDGLRVALLAFDVARRRTPHANASRNPFRDRRVRQAIALGIDRAALVKRLLPGRAAVSDQITAAQELGAYQASVPSRPFDPPGARRLLREAGLGGGFEVALDTADDPDSRAVANALAADLRRVGIVVHPRPQPDLALARRLDARDTSLWLRAWTSGTGDGRASYEALLHTPQGARGLANVGGYSDPALDGLLHEASKPLTTDERRLLLARLATKVALDVPVVPLFTLADVFAVADGVAFEPRLDGQIRLAEMSWEPR